jgi:hypothetical protein
MAPDGGGISLRILRAPKEGNSPEQYEDACAHTPLDVGASLTVALSDGASSAVFAREWAARLVGAFGDGSRFPDEDGAFARCVAELGREWRCEVENKATSWHAQEKLASGSSATLLVTTWDLAARKLAARAVGDVCLFLVRRDRLRYAFPLKESRRFGDRPDLLSTEIGAGAPCPSVLGFDTAYEPGDRFLLMTDALAAWFLHQYELKRRPWNDLPTSDAALTAWLKTRRDDGTLKNDDVTLVDLTL